MPVVAYSVHADAKQVDRDGLSKFGDEQTHTHTCVRAPYAQYNTGSLTAVADRHHPARPYARMAGSYDRRQHTW